MLTHLQKRTPPCHGTATCFSFPSAPPAETSRLWPTTGPARPCTTSRGSQPTPPSAAACGAITVTAETDACCAPRCVASGFKVYSSGRSDAPASSGDRTAPAQRRARRVGLRRSHRRTVRHLLAHGAQFNSRGVRTPGSPGPTGPHSAAHDGDNRLLSSRWLRPRAAYGPAAGAESQRRHASAALPLPELRLPLRSTAPSRGWLSLPTHHAARPPGLRMRSSNVGAAGAPQPRRQAPRPLPRRRGAPSALTSLSP